MTRYRLTCLTPLLVGDGQKLSPIDYMVWKDHVNVLDQRRIFRLLAKGPRLDSYLAQLKKADKLEFASWGGFAQNFAGRRIPFEHASSAKYWERATAENLHIPTFASGPNGPYLPGSAIKGALRTGALFERWDSNTLRQAASRLEGDRPPRRPAEHAENAGSGNQLKVVRAADSGAVPSSSFRVYLLRVARLDNKGHKGYELGWKQSPRGTVDGRRVEDSTPLFAEMAAPGTVFEGPWKEDNFFLNPATARALNWKDALTPARIFESANRCAEELLAKQKQYAELADLSVLGKNIEMLQARLADLRQRGSSACILSLGWGVGLLGKAAYLNTEDESYRQVLRSVPFYARAIQTGLLFPKTRRIVFLENQPATLPGWTLLEIVS